MIDDIEQRIVPVAGGRAGIFECFTAVRPAVGDAPKVSFSLCVEDGRIGCSCIAIEPGDGQALLSTADLAAPRLRLVQLMHEAIADNLWAATGDPDRPWEWPVRDDALVADVVGSMHRHRATLSDVHLARVAGAFIDGGWEAVAEVTGKSRSHAFYLRNRASEQGMFTQSGSLSAKARRLLERGSGT